VAVILASEVIVPTADKFIRLAEKQSSVPVQEAFAFAMIKANVQTAVELAETTEIGVAHAETLNCILVDCFPVKMSFGEGCVTYCQGCLTPKIQMRSLNLQDSQEKCL
jgi:hypothetical protein